MAKFILTYPEVAKVERRENGFFFSEMQQRRRSQMQYLREHSESKIRIISESTKPNPPSVDNFSDNYFSIRTTR